MRNLLGDFGQKIGADRDRRGQDLNQFGLERAVWLRRALFKT
jgi:hypothetical protein